MNLALWVAQCLLAVVFLGSGTAKSIQSKDRMIATGQTGVAPFPRVTALQATTLAARWMTGRA